MKAIKIVHQIPKKSSKDKSCLRMKQARLFLEHCEENDINCEWKLLRRQSGQDISTRAAKLWYTMQGEGKLNATIESIEEQCPPPSHCSELMHRATAPESLPQFRFPDLGGLFLKLLFEGSSYIFRNFQSFRDSISVNFTVSKLPDWIVYFH